MTDSLQRYNVNMQMYMDSVGTPFIFFEINKCCGYNQFIPTYRDGTLKDLHRAVSFHFGFKTPSIVMKNGEDLLIVQEEDTLLKDFMKSNQEFFKPAYPLPAKVVYRIYFAEKCCGCSPKPLLKEEDPLLEEFLELSDSGSDNDSDQDQMSITIEREEQDLTRTTQN